MLSRKLITRILLVVTLLCCGIFSYAQVDGDYRSRATGNWNNNATWQVRSGGAWVNCGAGDYPGASSGAGTVYIEDNHTISISADITNNIASLRIDGGNNDSYVQFTGAYSLTVTGLTYLDSDSRWDEKSLLVDAGIFSTGSLEMYM